jgi:hypothetical protein
MPTPAPATGSYYMVSAWVKENLSGGTAFTGLSYNNPRMVFTFKDGNSNVISTATLTTSTADKIIDGWQRIMQKILVPATAVTMDIAFVNTATDANASVYFDDFRMHPYNANIKTFVYDPVTLRHVADLDENNYGMFYIYDNEGALSKTMVETANGKKTINEGRNGTKH